MSQANFALCVKFAEVNPAQIVDAARKNQVAILHVENYNSKKDYNAIFREYPLEIPKGSDICLLIILPDGESFLTTKENLSSAFEKVNKSLIGK